MWDRYHTPTRRRSEDRKTEEEVCSEGLATGRLDAVLYVLRITRRTQTDTSLPSVSYVRRRTPTIHVPVLLSRV